MINLCPHIPNLLKTDKLIWAQEQSTNNITFWGSGNFKTYIFTISYNMYLRKNKTLSQI